MNEFFEFMVAQFSTDLAPLEGTVVSLLCILSFAAYVEYKRGHSSGREALHFVLGMIALNTILITGVAVLNWTEFDKLTSKAFNERISNNVSNFQGTANCQKEGLQLNGAYKTAMKVKELALTVNVPVSVHLQNYSICNLGYYPKTSSIERELQKAADEYISENSTPLSQALLEVTKPKTVEVKAVPQFKGVTVEMPVETFKATVPVQNVGQVTNIKPKQPVNINTNISGQ